MINQSGPFDFMVDTGSQLNVIDPALAALLNLKSQGIVGLVGTAAYSQASVGILDSLEAGSQQVFKPLVVVQIWGRSRRRIHEFAASSVRTFSPISMYSSTTRGDCSVSTRPR